MWKCFFLHVILHVTQGNKEKSMEKSEGEQTHSEADEAEPDISERVDMEIQKAPVNCAFFSTANPKLILPLFSIKAFLSSFLDKTSLYWSNFLD